MQLGVNIMKTIIIHIGREKTGTTSLQNFFALNYDKLLKYDIFYPTDENKKYTHWKQHITLVPSITKKKIFNLSEDINYVNGEALTEFVEDIKKVKQNNILISSEFFIHVDTPELVKYLKNKLNGYHVKIVVYIRRQDDFYLSTRQESLKIGRPFRDSVHRAKKYQYANYYERLNNWAQVFGNENLIVRIFEKEQMYKNNLYADFLKILGIEFDNTFIIPQRLNESISLEKALFLQRLSKYLVPYNDESNNKRFFHQEIRNSIIKEDFLKDGVVKDFFTYEERKEIMDYFEEENKRIVHDFIGIENETLFKEPISSEYSHTKCKQMNDDEFIRALIEYIERLYKSSKISDSLLSKLLMKVRDNNKLSKSRIEFEYDFIFKNDIFDSQYYLFMYEDVLKAGIDPIIHYIEYGWFEGRNPNQNFKTREYIMNNLELLDQDINPLVHYYLNKKS